MHVGVLRLITVSINTPRVYKPSSTFADSMGILMEMERGGKSKQSKFVQSSTVTYEYC